MVHEQGRDLAGAGENFPDDAVEYVQDKLAAGMPTQLILARLTREAEILAGPGAVSSILRIDEEGLLRNAASPNLPGDYLDKIDRLKPHPGVGTCAAAAATGEVVLTPDFCADERWSELRHLPMALGFLGAWSQPIKDEDGRVVGTFGTYFRERREPSLAEQRGVARLAEAAALALTH